MRLTKRISLWHDRDQKCYRTVFPINGADRPAESSGLAGIGGGRRGNLAIGNASLQIGQHLIQQVVVGLNSIKPPPDDVAFAIDGRQWIGLRCFTSSFFTGFASHDCLESERAG